MGSLKTGPRRAKFVLECVQDLRSNLQGLGSSLLVAHGKPEEVCTQILKKLDPERNRIPSVVIQEEVCSEERAVEKAIRSAVKKHSSKGKLEVVWGSTMYELEDLPFHEDLHDLPSTFTPFRNKVEKKCKIPPPKPTPSKAKLVLTEGVHDLFADGTSYSFGFMPTLADLGYTEEQIQHANAVDPRGVMEFRGGETAALARCRDYIWTKDCLKDYFDTRNGMIGADYSTKFSPWLAHGCLSARHVTNECKRYEEERIANKSTYWVVFELLWRDYCKFFALKEGNSIFFVDGPIQNNKKWSSHPPNVQKWIEGKTGFPLVDANMRELAATGFMSNRGRQNVCSFLALDLNEDWRRGAEYFETILLDHDVHSNWVSWCAGAGMTGGRVNRFNIVKQSKDYDQHGEYVKLWVPELKKVSTKFVHEPWKMTQFQQAESDCRLGVDYPNPMIPPFVPKYDNKNGGGGRGGGNNNKRGGNNSRRGRGQRQDMKSVPQGNFRIG